MFVVDKSDLKKIIRGVLLEKWKGDVEVINESPYSRWKIHIKVKTDSNKTLDYKPVMVSKDSPNKKKALEFAKKQWKQDYEREHGKIKSAKLVVIFNAS